MKISELANLKLNLFDSSFRVCGENSESGLEVSTNNESAHLSQTSCRVPDPLLHHWSVASQQTLAESNAKLQLCQRARLLLLSFSSFDTFQRAHTILLLRKPSSRCCCLSSTYQENPLQVNHSKNLNAMELRFNYIEYNLSESGNSGVLDRCLFISCLRIFRSSAE